MLFALLLATLAPPAEWVPMRWPGQTAQSLALLEGTPVNCLLLERERWQPELLDAAAKRGLATLAVVRPGFDGAVPGAFAGVVLEGDFAPAEVAKYRDSGRPVIELVSRYRLRFDGVSSVAGTWQGVWPGIQLEEEGSTKSAPSGAPWINTNTGFLRFAKAASKGVVWIGVRPPEKNTFRVERYLQAIGDAAMSGARWVVALDADFEKRLLGGDDRARKDWERMARHLRFYEEHREWRGLDPYGLLALVEDTPGALLSGGILDMIAVKHTPVRPMPTRRLQGGALRGAQMAVNVNPETLSAEQQEALRTFARSGGTLLTGPPGWKFPAVPDGQITLADEAVKTLDTIWKELNSMTGRRNLGVRLFNVASMLSNLTATADGKTLYLHLVNYSDYPVDSVTAHVLGRWTKAKLYTPEGPPKDLEIYPVDEGTGIDIPALTAVGVIRID
ncbi:MAG: hypothetical protein SFV54_21270 [Bryobacteraceae bacterium]|nr:hypothetical protein [Bryobacteraceae bacterium]